MIGAGTRRLELVSAAGVVCALGTVLMLPAAASSDLADEAALLKQVGFSAFEIQKIARGETVARTTEADSAAVALAVAGTVAVPAAFYVEKFRAIESFKKTAEVRQIGRFSAPPRPDDIAALVLEEADVDDLRGCRIDDCGLKLDIEGIQKLARPDAQISTASAAIRPYLAAYASRYAQRGNASLMEYRSASNPRRLADELHTIMNRSEYLRQRWPALFAAVANYSGPLPPDLDGFLYWSKEKIGPRAVVSITHVIISPLREGRAAIATKQIYASHYSDASLGVTMLLEYGTAADPRTRVIYVNRTRLDIFGGLFGSIKRPLVRSRAREGAERTMRGLRDKLEREYRASH